MRLSARDRRILNSIQREIALTPRPFAALGHKIGETEEEVIARLKELKKEGYIRTLSGRLNHRRMGFKSALVGFRVPAHRIGSLAKKLSGLSEVTHCYLRDGDVNLWAVFIYKRDKLEKILRGVKKEFGRENILNLPTKKQFKLKTRIKT